MSEEIKLGDVEIKSFRGIKNYTLKTSGKSIVFCGANGSGKSSFVNAFEFLFTGKVKSLTGVRGLNHDKSIIHIGDDKNDVLVEASINGQTMRRTLKNGLECDDELNDLYDDFKNGSFILNRKKLLEFIESQPAQRWKLAAELIGLTEYDDTEKVFEKVNKEFKASLKSKKDELDDNTAKLENTEINEIYEEINQILKENNFSPIAPEDDLNEFLKDNAISTVDLGDINVEIINEKYQNQMDIFDRIALDELKGVNSLLSLIKSSKNYISSENPESCPICQREIDIEKTMNDLTEKENEIENANSKLKNWQNQNNSLIVQIKNLNNKLPDYDLDDLIEDIKKLNSLEITPSQMDRQILANLNDELTQLMKNETKLNEAFDKILLLADRQVIEREIEKLEAYYEVSQASLDSFSETKKKKIQELFEDIGSLIGEYYKFIHEDDFINNPKFTVQSSKGLVLALIFGDDEGDPRSYSSEGHLDSLGLCIFLAFAKLYNKYNFLLLDDIISTVDLDHKERIIHLLFEKFSDYTFIITTHNKLWFEQLQRLASSNNMRNNFTFIEILDWDQNEGPILSRNMTDKKRIEEHLEVNDTFAAGNAIRRYFEFAMDDLCKMNGIRLPIKSHYAAYDYYVPLKDFFLEELFIDTNVEDFYKDVFKKLDDTTYMGNLTSHNNEKNYDLTRGEIEKFKKAVYNFENAFKCEKHPKQYLKFDKKKKIGLCGNKKCQEIFKFHKV